jgi:hypothetical protein
MKRNAMKNNQPRAPHPARAALAASIKAHLMRGQRADKPEKDWKPWTDTDFAAAVDKTPGAVRHWCSKSNPVPPIDVNPILNVFFGDVPKYANWRRELHDKWAEARLLFPADPDETEAESPRGRTSEWSVRNFGAAGGIATARLHPPRPSNDDTFCLDATAVVGIGEYELDGEVVLIGVQKVLMEISSPSYQPAKGSLIGEREPPQGVRVVPEGVEFTPTNGRDVVDQSLFGDQPIAVMEPTSSGGEETVTLLLKSGRGFKVSRENVEVPNGREKDVILNAIIFKDRKPDRAGGITLARSLIRRKKDAT